MVKPSGGLASGGESAIEKSLELHPDIVLLDHSLPDGSGIDAVGEILAAWPDTKIIMLTITESDDLLIRAVSNGAVGYLLKNIPISKLFRVLNGVSNGEAALSRKMTARILKEFSLVSRTRQVKESLAADSGGASLQVISVDIDAACQQRSESDPVGAVRFGDMCIQL